MPAATPEPAQQEKLAFIGFGAMATSIAQGLVRAGHNPAQLFAYAPHQERLQQNCNRLGVTACPDAVSAVQAADIVVLAIKPAVAPAVCGGLTDALTGKTVVSVMWGYDLDRLQELLPADAAGLCTIPNLPVSTCSGIWIVEDRDSLGAEQRAQLDSLLSCTGRVLRVAARLMPVAGALAGCGPAYAALFCEALADAGVSGGLKRSDATLLAAQMLAGTGSMLAESGLSPAILKDQVCSPGGSTIKGVEALEHRGLRAAAISALHASLGH